MNSVEKNSWNSAVASGLKTYASGRRCKACKMDERYVSNMGCVACIRLRASKAYRADPENELQLAQIPESRDEAVGCGLPYYFTGERCGRNHLAKRVTKTGRCFACLLKKMKAEDREKFRY